MRNPIDKIRSSESYDSFEDLMKQQKLQIDFSIKLNREQKEQAERLANIEQCQQALEQRLYRTQTEIDSTKQESEKFSDQTVSEIENLRSKLQSAESELNAIRFAAEEAEEEGRRFPSLKELASLSHMQCNYWFKKLAARHLYATGPWHLSHSWLIQIMNIVTGGNMKNRGDGSTKGYQKEYEKMDDLAEKRQILIDAVMRVKEIEQEKRRKQNR